MRYTILVAAAILAGQLNAQESLKQTAYIKAANPHAGDHFGCGGVLDGHTGNSVAVSTDGNTMAVGAPHADTVYVFSRNGTAWADQANNSLDGSGAVYVFTRTGTTWAQQAYIKSSMPAANVLFGYAVVLNGSGDTMVASSYDDDRGKGAMYVFTRTGSTWSQQARLQASIAERGDSFGVAVALSNDGNTLAVGSHDEDCLAGGVNPKGCDNDQPSDTSAGAAVVFVRTGNAWTEQALLKASNPAKGDTF